MSDEHLPSSKSLFSLNNWVANFSLAARHGVPFRDCGSRDYCRELEPTWRSIMIKDKFRMVIYRMTGLLHDGG